MKRKVQWNWIAKAWFEPSSQSFWFYEHYSLWGGEWLRAQIFNDRAEVWTINKRPVFSVP